MAYQAMYRQWRPLTFSQVIGQEAIVKTLKNQIETGRIAHAYLFCGCHGTGKTTLAKIMSRTINCQSPIDGEPCGKCASCQTILEETSLDVLEFDAASKSRVEEIRDLLDQVRYPPQVGRYKVYIIDEVHMLSTAAFNALLKTLEEPPAHVVFILATTEPQKLPATILSRVQRYDFGRIPASLMIGRMNEALESSGMKAQDEALEMIARAAEGAMRDAFSILDMCVAGAEDGVITASQVRAVLGTSDKDFLFNFAQEIAKGNAQGVMQGIDELMRSGREPQVFLREMTGHFRALMTTLALQNDAADILDVTENDAKRYREQAQDFSQARLIRMMELFMRAEGEMRYASTPRVALEIAALTACQQTKAQDQTALLERVQELEGKLSALQGKLESGEQAALAAQDKPAKQAPAAAAPAPTAPKKTPDKPAPANEQELWTVALDRLKKTEPGLFGLIHNEKLLGVEGSTLRILIPVSRKDFTYMKVNQPKNKDRLSALLTEISGKPMLFEARLDVDQAQLKVEQKKQSTEEQLISAFGREIVQIDDSEDNA